MNPQEPEAFKWHLCIHVPSEPREEAEAFAAMLKKFCPDMLYVNPGNGEYLFPIVTDSDRKPTGMFAIYLEGMSSDADIVMKLKNQQAA